MADSLADLDELSLRCRSESAKAYIGESISAYQSGAYRAAIVTAWIEVVLDILDKLKELADSGDANAKIKIAAFEGFQDRLQRNDMTALDAALKFERQVLELARDDFELLDGQEFVDLQRLREDRNRCAHPTFHKFGLAYQPSAELARTHIRNAIIHLLQHPPVQGKAALNALQARVASEFFPRDAQLAKQSLSESALRRPTEALVRGFIDLLFLGLLEVGGPLRSQRSAVAAIQATLELHRPVAEARLKFQVTKRASSLPDDDLVILAILAADVPEVWEALELSQKERLKNYIRKGQIIHVGRITTKLLSNVSLREALTERAATATVDDLQVLVGGGLRKEAVSRAIEHYEACRSWEAANKVGAKLIVPLVEVFTEADIERILKAPDEHGADLRGSGQFQEFLDRVRETKVVSPSWLDSKLKENNMSSYIDDSVEDSPIAQEGKNDLTK